MAGGSVKARIGESAIVDADWDDETCLLGMITHSGLLLVYRVGLDAAVGFVANKELGNSALKIVIRGK